MAGHCLCFHQCNRRRQWRLDSVLFGCSFPGKSHASRSRSKGLTKIVVNCDEYGVRSTRTQLYPTDTGSLASHVFRSRRTLVRPGTGEPESPPGQRPGRSHSGVGQGDIHATALLLVAFIAAHSH